MNKVTNWGFSDLNDVIHTDENVNPRVADNAVSDVGIDKGRFQNGAKRAKIGVFGQKSLFF